MQINKVAFIGKGGVGLLYGSMIAKALGNDAVEYVMDDTRFERHANDALTVNGKPCDLTSVRASEATPADLVILTVKTTGLDQALKTMERVVGPNTLIASLCNGITSEQKIAERFGWEHTVLGICQGMAGSADAPHSTALTAKPPQGALPLRRLSSSSMTGGRSHNS